HGRHHAPGAALGDARRVRQLRSVGRPRAHRVHVSAGVGPGQGERRQRDRVEGSTRRGRIPDGRGHRVHRGGLVSAGTVTGGRRMSGMAGRTMIEWGPFRDVDTMTVDGREYVTTAKAAALAKVKPSTFLAYSRRGQAPAPAGKVERVL